MRLINFTANYSNIIPKSNFLRFSKRKNLTIHLTFSFFLEMSLRLNMRSTLKFLLNSIIEFSKEKNCECFSAYFFWKGFNLENSFRSFVSSF